MKKPVTMKCPTCGAAKRVRDTRDLTHTYKGETTTIADVKGKFCPACSEALLDTDEMAHVNAAMLSVTKQVTTPMCSRQSNGMVASSVNTFKLDYVARMDPSNAATVMEQLPPALEHFNEAHPHPSVKIRSTREFWRHQAAQARHSNVKDTALRCK